MLDSNARHLVQKHVETLVKVTRISKIHPNILTLIGFLTGIAAACFIAFGNVTISLILLWTSGLVDMLDGTVARYRNISSKLGAYLDLVFDRMVESAVILAFYFLAPEYAFIYLMFFVVVLFNFSSFLLAGTFFVNKSNKSMHYDFGLIERTETFITFSLMIIFPNYILYFLGIFNILVFLTGMLRTFKIIIHEK